MQTLQMSNGEKIVFLNQDVETGPTKSPFDYGGYQLLSDKATVSERMGVLRLLATGYEKCLSTASEYDEVCSGFSEMLQFQASNLLKAALTNNSSSGIHVGEIREIKSLVDNASKALVRFHNSRWSVSLAEIQASSNALFAAMESIAEESLALSDGRHQSTHEAAQQYIKSEAANFSTLEYDMRQVVFAGEFGFYRTEPTAEQYRELYEVSISALKAAVDTRRIGRPINFNDTVYGAQRALGSYVGLAMSLEPSLTVEQLQHLLEAAERFSRFLVSAETQVRFKNTEINKTSSELITEICDAIERKEGRVGGLAAEQKATALEKAIPIITWLNAERIDYYRTEFVQRPVDLGGRFYGAEGVVHEINYQMDLDDKKSDQAALLVEWEGGKIPYGVVVNEIPIGWMQNGYIHGDQGESIGTYGRFVDCGGDHGKQQLVILFLPQGSAVRIVRDRVEANFRK